MDNRCTHCGQPIVRFYADYTAGWIHRNRDGSVWCRTTMATPAEEEQQ